MSLREGQEIIWRNALNQITKNLEHLSTKSKRSPRALENMPLQRLKQVRTLCAATLMPASAHLGSGGQVTESETLPDRQSQASGLDHAHVHFLPREFFRTKHHKMCKDAPVPNRLRVRKQEKARLSPTFKPE